MRYKGKTVLKGDRPAVREANHEVFGRERSCLAARGRQLGVGERRDRLGRDGQRFLRRFGEKQEGRGRGSGLGICEGDSKEEKGRGDFSDFRCCLGAIRYAHFGEEEGSTCGGNKDDCRLFVRP